MTALLPLSSLFEPVFASVPMGLAEASLADSRDELQRIFADASRELVTVRQTIDEAQAQFDHYMAESGAIPDEEFDRAIPLLLAKEQAAKASHERSVAIILKLEANAAQKTPDLLPDVKKITRLFDGLQVAWLETLRDLRWAAMAERAARLPPETGPIMATRADFERWAAELGTTLE